MAKKRGKGSKAMLVIAGLVLFCALLVAGALSGFLAVPGSSDCSVITRSDGSTVMTFDEYVEMEVVEHERSASFARMILERSGAEETSEGVVVCE